MQRSNLVSRGAANSSVRSIYSFVKCIEGDPFYGFLYKYFSNKKRKKEKRSNCRGEKQDEGRKIS